MEQTSAGVVTGTTTDPGNVITDPGPTGAKDTAPAGTLVTSVTSAQSMVIPVRVGGVDIPELYGTLQIDTDGSYTYTLNSGISPASVTSRETFSYTLNDQNGHTDRATLTINMNPQFVSGTQNDVITGSVYGDTLVYHLLNSTGWNGSGATLNNYLNVSTSGANTVISIDRDASGSAHSSTILVTLDNVGYDTSITMIQV